MNRLGVIGTMVWDSIYGWAAEGQPIHEWGGIAYALAALETTLPADWQLVPLIKVGRDLAPQANRFLATLGKRATGRFVEVPEANNRVTLRYESATRRTERLTGRVPGWRWSELGPMVQDVDALYVNFIAGWELDLEAARLLRRGYRGPIYADLHSLLLSVAADGTRVPQRLPRVAEWFACFDVVQLNEDEMRLIGDDPMAVAAQAFAQGVRCLIVTLGARGAAYFCTPDFDFTRPGAGEAATTIRTARIEIEEPPDVADPTGCGDVFGASLVSQLIQGRDLEEAIRSANALAARNVMFRGASGLAHHLRGEIVPR